MATPKSTEASSKKAAGIKKAAAPRKKTVKPSITTSEDRIKMIEVTAYYIAEKNGFGENHMEYWLQAEKEVDGKLTA